MSDVMHTPSEFILYQTEDGRTRIQCRFENETIWLSQIQIAELFQTTKQNIAKHLKAIFAERIAAGISCQLLVDNCQHQQNDCPDRYFRPFC